MKPDLPSHSGVQPLDDWRDVLATMLADLGWALYPLQGIGAYPPLLGAREDPAEQGHPKRSPMTGKHTALSP